MSSRFNDGSNWTQFREKLQEYCGNEEETDPDIAAKKAEGLLPKSNEITKKIDRKDLPISRRKIQFRSSGRVIRVEGNNSFLES
jgi:hypothetical protein